MPFSEETVRILDQAEEVEIETRSERGDRHLTTIWVVVADGEPYIRSVRGAPARWYREAIAGSTVRIHVDGRSIDARVEPATSEAAVERTSAALRSKYATDPAMRSMVRPHTLETTLRLVPF